MLIHIFKCIVPDFRSATGLFASVKNDYKVKASGKLLFDACVYKDDQSTSSFHDMVRDLKEMSDGAQPTTFHHLLASLAASNRLLRLYTQNVDCIETSLEPLKTQVPLNIKGPWPKTIQLHGGLEKMVCQKCGALEDFDAKLFKGSKPPDCDACIGWEQARGAVGKRPLGIGKLRPRIVLYNEFNPDADAIGEVSHADLKARPDALIIVGTSLKIPGVRRLAREMCATIRSCRGGKTIWINQDDPPTGKDYEGIFDLVVKGDCEKVAKLANVQQWDMPPISFPQPLTSTGKQYGLSTPQSLLSDCDSPLSSPVSYTSEDELEITRGLSNAKTSMEVTIPPPPPPPPLLALKLPLAILAKTKKITISKTKTKVCIPKSSTKLVTKQKSTSTKKLAAKSEKKSSITKVFKAGKITSKPSSSVKEEKQTNLPKLSTIKSTQKLETATLVHKIEATKTTNALANIHETPKFINPIIRKPGSPVALKDLLCTTTEIKENFSFPSLTFQDIPLNSMPRREGLL